MDIEKFLADRKCQLKLSLSQYQGSRLVSQKTFSPIDGQKENRQIEFGGAVWSCDICAVPMPQHPDGIDLTLSGLSAD